MSYRGAGTVRGPLHFNGTASPGVSSSGQGRIYFDSGSNSFRVSQNGGSYVDLSVGVPPLSSVLASGSTTSGNNIVISTGDNLALGALALLRSNGQQGGFLLRNGPDNDYGYLEAQGISNFDTSGNYLSSFGITNAEVNSDWTINFSSSPTDATLTDTRIGRDGAGFVGFYDASLNYAGIAALVHYIGTDGFVESADATGAPISAANTGRIRYNDTTKTFQQSVDTGAWVSLATTLQQAYTNGGAGGGSIALTLSGGPLEVTAPNTTPAITVTGQYYSAEFACTTTVNWNDGNAQAMTLANGNNTFTFTNAAAGGRYLLKLKQPAAGAAGTVTWPVELLWSGGTPPTLTATNDKTDIVTLYYDGTNFFGGYTLNY